MTWDDIALLTGTDKSSAFHGYCDTYEQLLGSRKVDRLLELGVAGGRSLQLWRTVLPDTFIVGVDNGTPSMLHQRERSAVVLADMACAPQMAAVSTLYGPFNVVIDDGSHQHDDVRLAFEELFPRLAPGGVYIIEDLDLADGWVRAYFGQHHATFVPIPDRLNRLAEPGLIVVDASW